MASSLRTYLKEIRKETLRIKKEFDPGNILNPGKVID